jgi:hypothetical protein
MLLKHVNNSTNACFQDPKVIVSAVKSVFFVKISPFLQFVCLLIFSILKILDGRFLVKKQDKIIVSCVPSLVRLKQAKNLVLQ